MTRETELDVIEDEDVRIAVRALGQMRSGNGGQQKPFVFPPSSSSNNANMNPQKSPSASTSHTPALSLSLASTHPGSSPPHTPPLDDEADAQHSLDGIEVDSAQKDSGEAAADGGIEESGSADGGTQYSSLARMQSLPLVSGALRVYEAGKANSRVVQYTSSLVTSSLRHASSHLPAGSGERIDEFAGGMLDRLEKYRRSPAPPAPASGRSSAAGKMKKTLDGSPVYRDFAQPGPYNERGEYAHGPRYGRREGGDSYDDGERGYGEEEREGREYDERDGEKGKGKGKRRWHDEEEGRGKGRVPGWLEATSPFVPSPGPPPPLGRGSGSNSASSRHEKDRGGGGNDANGNGGEERQVAARSRWQAVLLEAGGLSAALSDESMRRLRYCLSWLQYATQHIDAQILILRDFIASLHPPGSGGSLSISTSGSSSFDNANAEPELTPDHLRTLAHLRSDIVHTIRQVVGVVSKYAGGALPEPARGRVRGFILDLPKRFSAEGGGSMSPGGTSGAGASATGVGSAGTGTAARRSIRRERGAGSNAGDAGSPTPSAPGSPHTHIRPLHHNSSRRGSVVSVSGEGTRVEPGKALAAAHRVLVLATESLDMMRGVTAVVGDSLDRADAWVDRLRTMGIQRGMDGLALPGPNGDANGEHGHWAGVTPAWTGSAGTPRSPGYTSTSDARSPTYAPSEMRSQYASTSGTRSPSFAPSPAYVSGAPSPGYTSGAPSPGFGLGGMSLGSSESRYSTPAPGAEDERDEREGRMEVDG